jgi:RecG-like helicase
VVATIVPFDVNRITSGKPLNINHESETLAHIKAADIAKPTQDAPRVFAPVTHYADDVTAIGEIQWRKRSMVHGRVTSISTAPRGSAPILQVEVWDHSGGITLNFLGRREIAGLEVGMEMRAEGMVGEEDGQLVILNPSYELLI